ncbi:CHAP domain-containing protein [Nonomuraea guangzhouensis]|uniref:CHAP domain-containing protein n=1 Tax=Nonomuraea guangzhouensis TaxID=1291555 RepID=A0ABW4GCN9_9ACTN|nr:CHAP domain-containing protein [Nonomuraea guangzhouensis]
MRGEVGYREKGGQLTKFGQWYADRVKDPQYRDAPWCDMFIAWAADKAGIGDYVGQFAWTPSHAAWFIKQGAWSQQPEPGALVFYDWGGGKSYKGIDHVGIVERVDGKKIHTIEANVDRVWLKRKSRDMHKDVVGYGLPRVVQANATLNDIRSTEHPLARQPQPMPRESPLDVLGSPLALLTVMVLTTVVVSLRLAGRRRGTHRRFTWPWNASGKPASGKPTATEPAPTKPRSGNAKPQPGNAKARRATEKPGPATENPAQPASAKSASARSASAKRGSAKVGSAKAASRSGSAKSAARGGDKDTRSASYAEAPLEPVRVGGPPTPARALVPAQTPHHSTTRRKPYEPRS